MDPKVLTWVVIAAAVVISIGVFAGMMSPCAPNEVRVRAVFGTACVVGR